MSPLVSRSIFAALLGFALLVGLVLRLWVAIEQFEHTWIDELHTAWCISGDFDDVFGRSLIGNQSPLFFWLEYWLNENWELNSFRLRLPSLFSGTLALLATAWLAWTLSGESRAAVLVAISCASLEASWIFYDTEARPYSTAKLVVLIQFLIFWRYFFSQPGRAWYWELLLILASGLLFYLHYTTIFFVAFQYGLVAVVFLLPDQITNRLGFEKPLTKNIFWTTWIRHIAFLTLVFAPGLSHLFLMSERSAAWGVFADASSFFKQLRPLWWCYFLIPGLILNLIWIHRRLKRIDKSEPVQSFQPIAFVILVAWLPILSLLILSWVRLPGNEFPILSLGHLRYCICSLALMPLSIGLVVGLIMQTKVRMTLGFSFCILIAATNPLVTTSMRGQKTPNWRPEPWAEIAHTIEERTDSNSSFPVFLFPNLLEDAELSEPNHGDTIENYCRYPLHNRLVNLPSGLKLFPMPTWADNRFQPSHLDAISERRGAYLVIRGTDFLVDDILDELSAKCKKLGLQIIVPVQLNQEGQVLAIEIRVTGQ